LPKRWLTLPLLTLDLKFPEDRVAWADCDYWTIGRRFFFESGNDLEKLLWRARCMNAILSAGLGLVVYAWSRQLFGAGGGMISLLAYSMSPTILANASLATSDMAAAAFFTVAIGGLWKMFHKLSPGSVVGCWLALSGLFLAKMSAILIIPMGVALLAIRLIGRRPLTVGWRGGVAVERRWAQAAVLLGTMLLQAALVLATIWAAYGFRYSAFHVPIAANEDFYQRWNETVNKNGAFGQALKFARDHRLLPEAYLVGAVSA